jgi:hypothetical protein
MCYGDIAWGRDGYAEEEYRRAEEEAAYWAAEERRLEEVAGEK